MPLGKVLWEKVRVLDNDTYLFALDGRFRHLLLAMVERLTWRAAYQGDTVDAEWDTIQALVEDGTNGLMSSTKVQDLIDAQEETTRAIRETACCVTGGDPIPSGDVTITPVAIEQEEPPLDTGTPSTWPPDLETDDTGATGFADLAALSDYLCRAATSVFDMLLDMLTVASWYFQISSGITVIMREIIQVALARLFPTATGSLAAFTFDNLDSWLQAIEDGITSTIINQTRVELEAERDAIVCAMANATSWQDAMTDVQTILQTAVTSTIARAWIISGGLLGFAIGILFRAWADPEDNACTCAAPQVETSFFTQYSTTCDVPNPNLVEYPLPREHLTTNVAREFQSVNHRTECSAVSRIDVMLRDDDLANDPIAAPTLFKARYTTFVPDTDAGAALRFYSNTWTILAEYTNAQIIEGDWYTAPANTVRVMWTFDKFNDTVVAELMITEE